MEKPVIGKKFGRLTVMEFDHKLFAHAGTYYYYRCLCDCGTECVVMRQALVSGDCRSCGCLRREVVSERRKGLAVGARENSR